MDLSNLTTNEHGEPTVTITLTGCHEIYRFAHHMEAGQVEFGMAADVPPKPDRLAALQREQFKLAAEQIRHGARLKVYADWLNRIDATMTALEAHHSDAEHAGGDADPSEAHLQPNDREQPAGVACDAVSGIAKNHLPTQPKEHIMKTITVDGVEYAPINPDDSPVRIVILQRGWVVVGYWQRDGEDVTITSGKVIRKWGTKKGLGELVDGPTADTVLDPAGTVRAHILGVVATLDADTDAWGRVL